MERRNFFSSSLVGLGVLFSSAANGTVNKRPGEPGSSHFDDRPRDSLKGSEEPKEEQTNRDEIPRVDTVRLEIGYHLIPLIAEDNNACLKRIKCVRKKISKRLGFSISEIHIQENLELSLKTYCFRVLDVIVAEGQIYPDRVMAIQPEEDHLGKLQGIVTREPVFDLPAFWIEPTDRNKAERIGYTVVDAGTVIATHLNEVLSAHAHDVLGYEEVQEWRDRLSARMPMLAQSLKPEVISLAVMCRVFRNLLFDGIAIKDQRTIAETLAEYAPSTKDPEKLAAQVKLAIKRIGTPGTWSESMARGGTWTG